MPSGKYPLSLTASRRAADARVRASERLAGAMADFFLPDDARLDDRTRLALADRLGRAVDAIEAELRRQAARLLAARGATAAAEALLAERSTRALERLNAALLLRDEALIGELLAQVRFALLSAALPTTVSGEEGSLLVRLTAVPDRIISGAAKALLAAEAREADGLPAELQHRLTWQVAAAVRPPAPDVDADTDRAIAEAAMRSLGAQDEGDRADAVASRLALAIDARPDELAPLLLEALGDRRLSLFTAVLAHAIGIDWDEARAVVLEPEGERLWLALRAAQLDRGTIATIALVMSEADPRRDIEEFVDELDRIAAIEPAEARRALAPETLHRDFRVAIAALARAGR